MHFDSLPEDVVVEIFSRLELTELLATERVSKRWQEMVRVALERNVKTLVMRRVSEKEHDLEYVCRHKNHSMEPSKEMSLEKMFNYIVGEKQAKVKEVEEVVGKRWLGKIDWSEGFRTLRGQQLFASCLAKLGGVRSIHFSYQRVSVQTLVQAFELCPQLECFKVGCSGVDEEKYFKTSFKQSDWRNFLIRFGHRLVHVSVGYGFENSVQLLLSLCRWLATSNHRLDLICFFVNNLTKDIFTPLQQICHPNTYIQIYANRFPDNVKLIDIVNELDAGYFHWNALPDECRRLSLLSFYLLINPSHHFKSVNFPALKTLIVWVNEVTLQVLSRCQFPTLNKLKLIFPEAIADVNQLLERLFQKMPALKTIKINELGEQQDQLPGPAVLQLKRLTEISWYVLIDWDWDLPVMIEAFDWIQLVPTLKKLTIKLNLRRINVTKLLIDQWRQAIEQRLAALKKRRPEVEVIDHWIRF